ncbi:unnamed protein product [Ectocarpus fasciculatus]
MQWQHRKETRKENSRRERNAPGGGGGGGGGGPSSPSRAALHNGMFHSTGSMAFGSGVPASPSLHRQTSSRSGGAGSSSGGGGGGGGGSVIGSPSPRKKGGGSSGWGSGQLNVSTPGRAPIGRTGSASSSSSAVSAGGGPMVDSRGAGAAAGGQGGGEGARAAAAGGGGGGPGAGGGGEGGKDPAAKSLPSTPQKEARNPLLMTSFTPSPTFKGSKQARMAATFASTGGSHRLPPPPLPARPVSVERAAPALLSKLQSSPDLARGVGGGGPGGAMPPPLPDRPSSAVFEKADLHAIRESNASSLRSSASASDVLSGGRRTESTTTR